MATLVEVRRSLSVATAEPNSATCIFEECDLCHETYCSMCFLFHMDQPHAKTNETVAKDASERRIA
jgi:hypothetical protein